MDGKTYTRLCEGSSNTSYFDPIGQCWTVGVGCTGPDIAEGTVWTDDQVSAAYSKRYSIAQIGALNDVGRDLWGNLDPVRQAALTDMAFEIGVGGLAGFPHMLACVRAGNWQGAHDACLESQYATQVSQRAHRTANMLLTGQWQEGYGG